MTMPQPLQQTAKLKSASCNTAFVTFNSLSFSERLLHIGCRVKYCSICSVKTDIDHDCFKNWSSSSRAMEADAILEGFINCEKDFGLRFLEVVGDGDASLLNTLVERGPHWCRSVKKIECANHVCKNVRVSLEDLVSKKSQYKGRGKLTQRQRIRIVNSVRGAIRMRNTQFKDTGNRKECVQKLRKDIENCVSHVFGKHDNCSAEYCKVKEAHFENADNCTDDKQDANDVDNILRDDIHKQDISDGEVVRDILKTQSQYWTEMNPEEEEKSRYIPHPTIPFYQLPREMLSDINIILSRVTAKAHLLIENTTTNLAECWMAIRSKFDGGKIINRCQRGSWNARCVGAGLRFQNGPTWSPKVWKDVFKTEPNTIHVNEYSCREKQSHNSRRYKKSSKGKARRSLWKEFRNKSSTLGTKFYGVESTQVQDDLPETCIVDACKNFYNGKVKVTPQIAEIIEQDTRGQTDSEKWKEERSFRLTASTFHRVKVRNKVKFGYSKLVEDLMYKKHFQTADTLYGLSEEQETLDEYINKKKASNCNNVYTFKISGLIVNIEKPFLAASPDCLVSENDEHGLAEFKNLSRYRYLTIKEAHTRSKLDKFTFPLKLKSESNSVDDYTLKRSHPHYTQCQGQLLVTNRAWVDYVLRTKVDIFVERIYPDTTFINNLENKLANFYFHCFLPELSCPRHQCRTGIREHVEVPLLF